MTGAELKLALIDRFGALWFCDPDFYPIQRQDEIEAARERWSEVVADTEAFAAITADLGIDPNGDFDDDHKLAVYRAWKVLSAIALEGIGQDRYRFDYLAQPAPGAAEGTRTAGIIDATGRIEIEQTGPAGEPPCPICLARGIRIDAPDGPIAVERLRLGDRIWTLDAEGRRVVGTVLALGSATAPRGHAVIRLVLEDGRAVTASPGHPLADGRLIGDLRVGDAVDGSRVAAAIREPYGFGATFDLVVSGETGTYLVDGIGLGSTLGRPVAVAA